MNNRYLDIDGEQSIFFSRIQYRKKRVNNDDDEKTKFPHHSLETDIFHSTGSENFIFKQSVNHTNKQNLFAS